MFQAHDHVAEHVDDYLHDLLEPADADYITRHCADCPLCQAALAEARKRLALLQAAPSCEASGLLVQATLNRVEEHARQRRRRVRLWAAGGAVAAAAAVLLACHLYFLRLDAKPYDLQALSQQHVFARATMPVNVLLRDTRTNQVLGGVPVRVEMTRGSETVELAQFTTDADGRGRADVKAPDWPDGHYALRVIAQTVDSTEVGTQTVRIMRPFALRVLGQLPLFAGSAGSLRAGLFDFREGATVAGAQVKVELRDPKTNQTVQVATLTTGPRGIGQARYQLPNWADGDYELRLSTPDGENADVETQSIHLTRTAKLMISSDKPVYQPGQEIHVRALALRTLDLRPVAGEQLTFTIADPKGNIIFKRQSPTSAFGIASVDCPLAGEVLQGAYTIAASVGGTESKLTVQVQRYVLPKLLIDVTLEQVPPPVATAATVGLLGMPFGGGPFPAASMLLADQTPKGYYTPGEAMSGTVQVRYPFGNPVSGAAVHLSLSGHGANVAADVTTDLSGRASFRIGPTDGTQPENSDGEFKLEVTARDRAGQEHSRTLSRPITSLPARVEVIPEGGTLVPDVPNTVYLYASQADGTPSANLRLDVSGYGEVVTNSLGVATVQVTSSLGVSLTIRNAANQQPLTRWPVFLDVAGTRDAFLVRTDQAVYEGGAPMHLTVLGGGTEPVFLDLVKDGQTMLTETIEVTNGKGEATIDLPPELSGTLQLSAYRFHNASGLSVRKTRVLYVRPARQVQIAARLEKEYRPRQNARIEFTLTDEQGRPVPGALSLAVVDEAVFAVLHKAPGMERTFFLLEQQLLQPVYTIYPWSPDLPGAVPRKERGQFEQALFARTTRSELLPETGRLSLDHAQLDQDRLLRDEQTPSSRPWTSSSRGTSNAAARTTGLLWTTIGWIALGIGLALVAAAAVGVYLLPVLVAELGDSGRTGQGSDVRVFLHHEVLAVVLVGGAFVVIVGGAFILSQTRHAANSRMGAEDRAAVRDGRFGGGSTASTGGAMPSARAPQADGFPHKAADGSKPGPPPPPANEEPRPAPVRDWFPETLRWQPQLITDDRGRATLDLALADSITTWRLTASAVTADGRLGATRADIRVFQPFFIDLNLPVALTRNDEVTVPVAVYNYSQEAQQVRVTLARDDWFTPLNELEQTVTVRPGEVQAANYRVRAVKAGTYEVKVTARSGQGLQDAISRPIDVVPDGRRIEQVANGTLEGSADVVLDVPEGAIEGSPQAVLKLYPSSFSQLVEGLDAIFQMPSGCFEQTSSTTYPNVVALDYLKRTKKSAPEVEAKARQYIHLGYQRLLSFEVKGGGFDWFGRPPANLVLTAYGLLEFQDMARVHDVDPQLISRTRSWLLSERDRDGLWSPGAHGLLHEDPVRAGHSEDEARLGTTAYVAWAVFSGHADDSEAAAVRQYLLRHSPGSFRDAHLLALVCNALLAITPQSEDVRPYLDRLDDLKQTSEDGKRVSWKQSEGTYTTFYGRGASADVETTALAALALLQSGQHRGSASRALAWLVQAKGPGGTWYSTQATVLALKALVAGTGHVAGEERERHIHVALGDTALPEIVIRPDQSEVLQLVSLTKHLRPGRQTLKLRIDGQAVTDYQVAWLYHVADTSEAPKNEPLTVDLKYDRQNVQVGGAIPVTASVRNNRDEPAPMVMLDLPIPAGFVLDTAELDRQAGEAGAIAKYQVTPRQAIVYLRDLRRDQPLELRYTLRASVPANVSAAPARVYEYYSPEKQAFSKPGGRLTVTP